MQVFCAKYAPLGGSSFIPLPKKIQMKKAVLNIQNEDNKCLVWCLIAHKLNLDYTKNPYRVSHYLPHEDSIHLGDVECPVKVNKISCIEKLNNLRINVFGCEEDDVFPLYISNRMDSECINLLLLSDEERHHYCLIRDMSRLISSISKHDGACHVCYRCLHRFISERLLTEHIQYCKDVSIQRIKMPKPEKSILQFDKFAYQHPVSFVIYADFESLIVNMDSSEPNCTRSFTERVARHEACGYAYVVVGPDSKCVKPICVYRGPDAAAHFVNELLKEREAIAEKLNTIQPMVLTPQEELDFRTAVTCNLCCRRLFNDRVRDHDHLTGRYRGALHNQCNLQYRVKKMVPVIFHNLKNYDAHLIMTCLGKFKDYEYQLIATNMEKYITFSMSKSSEERGVKVVLQFLDSFQFLPTSLQKLVENTNEYNFKILMENIPSEKIQLLLRKGVYPYEYINNFEKFEEIALPPVSAFYSSLTGENISPQDYQHALNVWTAFNLRTMGEYHDLYVKSDVLQLADIFENFRKLCMRNYDLDPAHVFTAPGLAWQASLKMCKQPLELFTDVNMHLFIERGIRGGISTISTRHSVANNPYMVNYDSTSPSKYIMYLDANNLYGWAMSQPLPYGDFRWMAAEGITEEWILSIPADSNEGFIFEVDLGYPDQLHDLHNDYPLAPEKVKITQEMLSPMAKDILERLHNQKFQTCEKLVPNLNSKLNYITYHRNLQLYLSLGLKLIKIHKLIRFHQKPWLKPYIEFNTEKRKNASSTFEKDFFKLLNNSVYGKTMENIRNHVDIQLVNNECKAKKLVAAPSFRTFKIFDENLVGVERSKMSITLNRPIYVGFVILELSKVLMYEFHYNHIKSLYGERAKLLFTDTDSLAYEIETPDVYEDIRNNISLYDTSDYPQNHPLYSVQNKKKIGCFKDELNSKPIHEFVGLRAKMYSIQSEDGEKKTAKGVSRQVVRQRLKHADYRDCLLHVKASREKMMRIASESHVLYTIKQNKTALSPFDDKRYILEDGINTYAYGHYKIL